VIAPAYIYFHVYSDLYFTELSQNSKLNLLISNFQK